MITCVSLIICHNIGNSMCQSSIYSLNVYFESWGLSRENIRFLLLSLLGCVKWKIIPGCDWTRNASAQPLLQLPKAVSFALLKCVGKFQGFFEFATATKCCRCITVLFVEIFTQAQSIIRSLCKKRVFADNFGKFVTLYLDAVHEKYCIQFVIVMYNSRYVRVFFQVVFWIVCWIFFWRVPSVHFPNIFTIRSVFLVE